MPSSTTYSVLLLLASAGLLAVTTTYSRPLPAASRPRLQHESEVGGRLLSGQKRRRRRKQNLSAASSLQNSTAAALTDADASIEAAAQALAKIDVASPVTAAAVADPKCHAREHTGYSGDGAAVWGLNFKLADAGACCAACQAHAQVCGVRANRGRSWWPSRPDLKCDGRTERACTIWTFCPEERCFAFDIHKHGFGECWLKFQTTGGGPTRPKDPHYETGATGQATYYPEIMRNAPRKIWPWAVKEDIWAGPMPERVPWVSGVLAPPDTQIVSAPPDDTWRAKWCQRHGPCA